MEGFTFNVNGLHSLKKWPWKWGGSSPGEEWWNKGFCSIIAGSKLVPDRSSKRDVFHWYKVMSITSVYHWANSKEAWILVFIVDVYQRLLQLLGNMVSKVFFQLACRNFSLLHSVPIVLLFGVCRWQLSAPRLSNVLRQQFLFSTFCGLLLFFANAFFFETSIAIVWLCRLDLMKQYVGRVTYSSYLRSFPDLVCFSRSFFWNFFFGKVFFSFHFIDVNVY